MNVHENADGSILLVEPSATQALKLKRLLSRLGFAVTVARNGPEALAALDGALPRLVLCDVGLPGMDGYALCSKIRERYDSQDLPVVLLTSFLDPLGAVRALQCGADDLLPRIFDEGALLPHVRDVLVNVERRRSGDGSEATLEGVAYSIPAPADSRMLSLLLSSYRIAVHRSEELRQAQDALDRHAEDAEQAADAPPPTEAAGAPAPAPPAVAPQGLRVLLAEDSEVNQRLAVRTLERHGCRAVAAVNGEDALHAWEQEGPFDLILMDVEMPVMDGLEATRQVRAREQGSGRHVPIIAMTAHTSAENKQRCLDSGMDACLPKPLQMEAVLAALSPLSAQAPAVPPAAPLVNAPAAGDGDQPAVFERAPALARLGDDEDLLRELIGIFLTEAPTLLAQAQEALAAQDAPRLERAAHSLKGSAASLGAPALAAVAARLEAAGNSGDFQAAESLLTETEDTFHILAPRLREEAGTEG